MKLGIAGLPLSGKKTIFRLLTGSESAAGETKSSAGVADIKDARFDALCEMYIPKKKTPARIEIELLPDLDKRVIQDGVLRDIAGMDALCLVIRSFRDESVYHINGSVNPERDIDDITGEFILHDLVFIEKRLEKLNTSKKALDDRQKKESILLTSFREKLEQNIPLRTIEISQEEKSLISSYPFITLKELLIVLNTDDTHDNILLTQLNNKYKDQKTALLGIPVMTELEIAGLESEEERNEFMTASGITEAATDMLSRQCMESLGLMSFFTVGQDEVRQWQVKKRSLAPQAARVIHSDIERGFIRAEVMKFTELIEAGSEDQLKKLGKFYVMGKDYEVQDGDIINFRFNV